MNLYGKLELLNSLLDEAEEKVDNMIARFVSPSEVVEPCDEPPIDPEYGEDD